MKTICLDFDGVVNSYTSGWNDGKLDEPPVDGAIEWLEEITKKHKVIIHSARLRTSNQQPKVIAWLRDNGLSERALGKLKYEAKPIADVYIDDRAIAFSGSFPSAKDISNFKTWQH
jgi:hypothetical protein